MKNFLKNNWFKLVIIILILIVSIGYFEYFNLKIKQQNQIIQQINNSDSTNKISASDLAPYLTGVVYVLCNGESGSGSLTLQDSSGSFAVTNLHVVSSPFVDKNGNNYCDVFTYDTNNSLTGIYKGYTGNGAQNTTINNENDFAVLKLVPDNTDFNSLPLSRLNWTINNIPNCPKSAIQASPVVVLGYPAFAQQILNYGGINVPVDISKIISNGIISGYDTSDPKLPFPNYYISAKMDSGNSGGIALSKDNGNLCFLGVPTWIETGNFETEGIVQNINNILNNISTTSSSESNIKNISSCPPKC